MAADASKYAHSKVHLAVLSRDHDALRRILSSLPRLSDPSEIRTERASLVEEEKAESISRCIDRRDVPGRETPLHVAVRLSDPVAVEMLMLAGADWSLQNEQGWSALQEAICAREDDLARIIVRHYQPLAWAKWCRRLPRVVSAMRRMRDFYMEITFNFDSSVIPFISRIAPSDTYRIWKRGSNLRADMTLAGFDGFRIQRADQSVLFLGDGSEDGKVPPGSLCIVSHKDKEVMNALEGAGAQATEAEIQQEVAAMSQTNIFRPGIDVTQAVLLPQLTWRRQERMESVGPWKARVYDMHHVVVSIKSRRVPGAMTDEEFFASCGENDAEATAVAYDDLMTLEERKQLELALKMGSSDDGTVEDELSDGLVELRHSCIEREVPIEDASSCSGIDARNDRKRWFGGWGKKGNVGSGEPLKQDGKRVVPPRSSLCIDEKVSDLLGDSQSSMQSKPARHSIEVPIRSDRDRDTRRSVSTSENGHRRKEGGRESEYKKGLRPVLWLSQNFPLRTEELLPLLDILANKVKAIRRLRDLLTTKLPLGTFPVKVAIPVVPTIRVLVTFTKFEELQPSEEFLTPPSSPGTKSPIASAHSSSWLQWMKASYHQNNSTMSGPSSRVEDIQDPFLIPPDYTWTTPEAKKKKMQESKNKSKKGKSQSQS